MITEPFSIVILLPGISNFTIFCKLIWEVAKDKQSIKSLHSVRGERGEFNLNIAGTGT